MLQVSNKWKLLLLLWPVGLVTFLLWNVTYILFHCYLTVCNLDSKFPEYSCSLAPRAVSSRKKITGDIAQVVGSSKSLSLAFLS